MSEQITVIYDEAAHRQTVSNLPSQTEWSAHSGQSGDADIFPVAEQQRNFRIRFCSFLSGDVDFC